METQLWVNYHSGAELCYEGLSLDQLTQILELFQKGKHSSFIGAKISLDVDCLEYTGTYTLMFSSSCGGLDTYDEFEHFAKRSFNDLKKLRKEISEKLNID